MRLRIEKIEAMASQRPPGYVADVLSRGTITGEWLEISSEALAELRAIYRTEGQQSPAAKAGRGITGMGDLVAIVAQPVARAIDAATGSKIAKCGGCAKRREMLNAAFPIGKS